MSKDKRVYIKSVSSSGDSDKIRFFIDTSDDMRFSCFFEKSIFSVMKYHKDRDSYSGVCFEVYTSDISVLEDAIYLVADGHFKKVLEDSHSYITEDMIDIVKDAISVVESK